MRCRTDVCAFIVIEEQNVSVKIKERKESKESKGENQEETL